MVGDAIDRMAVSNWERNPHHKYLLACTFLSKEI